MSNYRRALVPGGTYFFTVVTHRRYPWFGDDNNIALLRDAFRHTRARRPFELQAIVVLPDHLHCMWKLPENDSDFSSRWRDIKKFVSRRLVTGSNARPERHVWQRRFWEHMIRDDLDWQRHLDYIHYNPVKHGLVSAPHAWRWSSFHVAVRRGWYESDWGINHSPEVADENWE
jgi:putative transposase